MYLIKNFKKMKIITNLFLKHLNEFNNQHYYLIFINIHSLISVDKRN